MPTSSTEFAQIVANFCHSTVNENSVSSSNQNTVFTVNVNGNIFQYNSNSNEWTVQRKGVSYTHQGTIEEAYDILLAFSKCQKR